MIPLRPQDLKLWCDCREKNCKEGVHFIELSRLKEVIEGLMSSITKNAEDYAHHCKLEAMEKARFIQGAVSVKDDIDEWFGGILK